MNCDCLKHDHQLAKPSAQHTGHVFADRTETINIDDLLEDYSVFNFALFDEVLINLLSKTGHFCRLFRGYSILLALVFSSDA